VLASTQLTELAVSITKERIMEILSKAISDASEMGAANVYWLLYPFGKISSPICCLTDYELKQIVKQYCELHNLETKEL